jgi:biotin carboxylase
MEKFMKKMLFLLILSWVVADVLYASSSQEQTRNSQVDPNKKTVVLIEPFFFGLGYVDAVKSKDCNLIVIVSDPKNPEKYGYNGKQQAVLIADVHDPLSIIRTINSSKYFNHIDAIISGNEYDTYVAAKVADYYGLKGTPVEVAYTVRRKDLSRACYEKSGMLNAKFQTVASLSEAEAAILNIGYPAILKPSDSAGSHNIFKLNSHQDLINAMDCLNNSHRGGLNFETNRIYLMEEYLEGPEFSVEIFLENGNIFFAAVTEKVTILPHFVEVMHIVPTTTYKEYQQEMINTAYKAVKAIGFTFGPCHVEMRLTKKGPIVIETNGRPGGGCISTDLLVEAFGINVYELVVSHLLGEPLKKLQFKNKGACTALLTAPRSGFVKELKGLDQLSDVFKYSFSVKPGDYVKIPESNFDRYGQLIVIGETPELAKEKAINAIKKIQFEYIE